jgi:hypothetical protein
MSFIRYSPEDSVISSETIVRGAWTLDESALTNFYTSSLGNNSYYLNIYDSVSLNSNQFSIQYGHVGGSGSLPINPSIPDKTPTRITYGQYRSLIYNDENSEFYFGNVPSSNLFAISIARSRFKESIKPGSLTLKLSGSGNISLTDDSIVNSSVSNFIGSNRYYNIISGSNGIASNSSLNTTVIGTYGMLFPDLGLVILNPNALSQLSNNGGIGMSIIGGSVGGNPNLTTLYNAIRGSGAQYFNIQSQETVSSRYFFTRVKNADFNYTTNPSIINSSGSLLYDTLIDNPQTYITTVGLYNDNNELLAVAKLSRPLVKDYTKETLIRCKLDY